MADRQSFDARHQNSSGYVETFSGFCSGSPSMWTQTGSSVVPITMATRYDTRWRDWDVLDGYQGYLEAGNPLPTQYYRDKRIQAWYPTGFWNEYGRCSTSDSWTLRRRGSGNFSLNNALTSDDVWVDSDLMAQCKLDLLNEIKSMDINIAVFSAEAGKTVDLFKSSFEKMFSFGIELRRGNFRRAYNALHPFSRVRRYFRPASRRFAQQWLEYSYAWTPLMHDLYGASKALAEELGGRPPVHSFSKRKTRDSMWTSNWNNVSPRMVKINPDQTGTTVVYTMPRTFDAVTQHTRTQVASAGLQVSPICGDVRNYGLNDPLLVAWELVPFSFVFDWFVSVGDYLSAATALRGLNVEAGYDGHLIFQTAVQTWYPRQDPGQGNLNGPVIEKRRNYTRSSWSGSLPSLMSLVSRDPLGINRITSAASLARIRFR